MAKRKIFLAEKVIPLSHEVGMVWCRVLAKIIPITIPTTSGDIPKLWTASTLDRSVEMRAMSATKPIPSRVPLRFDGENGISFLLSFDIR